MKTLKEAYKNYFTVGAAVAAHWIDEAASTVAAHFDTVTAENEMKYVGIHPHDYPRPDFRKMKPGTRPEPPELTRRERFVHPSMETDFAPADKICNFARENGLLVRGHTLMWHGSYPWGIFEQLTPEEIWANTLEHFEMTAKHFPDCWCWDVVNEVIDDHGGYLRDTVFKQKLGDDYLIKVYELARKYFPKAKLVTNDYNEFRPDKRDANLKLINILKERGLVDAIGCQSHINVRMTEEDFDNVKRGLDMYAATGLRIHVTEMDVNALDWANPDAPVPENAQELVAQIYGKMFKIFRDYSEVIDNVTVWGVSDKYSWLNGFKNRDGVRNFPLFFDEEYKPKEALLRVIDF